MLPAPEIGRFLECTNRVVKHGKVAGGNSAQVKPHNNEENSRVEHNPLQMDPFFRQRLPVEEQFRRLSSFFETMSARRTIRAFSPEPVPFELIETAIKTAATAPSGANQQPWRFVVVSSPEVKRQIREAAEIEEKEFYERRAPREWLAALEPLGTDWRKPFLETAPYLVIIFRVDYGLKLDAAGFEVKTKHYYASESVGIAADMLAHPSNKAVDTRITDHGHPHFVNSQSTYGPYNDR